MPNRLIAAALLAATPVAAAQAQERDLDTETSVGRVFAGQLAGSGEPATFLLTLRANQAIDLTAAPIAGSDPAVRVLDAATGEVIAANDDSNGSLASNVLLFSERNRRVRIEVSNAAIEGGDAPMRFDLVLRPSDYRPRPARDIAVGGEDAGTLASNEEQLYRFRGERGQVWVFAMASADGSSLDPAIAVFAGSQASGEPLASDDDGGGGLNSRLRFTVPDDGDYVLRAYGVGSSQGAYTLSASQSEALPPATLEPIGLDEPVTGTIDADVRERIYRLSDAATSALAADPGPLVIEMRFTGEAEGALDPIVAVGFETPLGFSAAVSDDDGAGGTNARLEVDASTLSPVWLENLRIKASGFLESDGPYELVVRRAGG